jgi:Uma2 family endonuclease
MSTYPLTELLNFSLPTQDELPSDEGVVPNLSLPTQDELPSDDGVPMETERHKKQMDLLIYTLEPRLRQQGSGYVNGNLFIYYSSQQKRHQDFKGPDVFVVLGVPTKERKSWVVWEEGKTPDVVIELLSESTAKFDKTDKKTLYQDRLKVAEYFWFDPFNPNDWAGFKLSGGYYEPLPVENERLVSQRLELALVRWPGIYQGIETIWLRWATLAGELLLLPEEAQTQRAELEAQRTKVAEQRAEVAEQQAQAEAQRAQTEAQRAQAAEQLAQMAIQRADLERQRAETAEAEMARLKALLAEKNK